MYIASRLPTHHPTRSSGMTQQRQKRWHSKIRDGCNNCRKRRVKCDEARPRCQNCLKGRLKCEWRVDNSGPRTTPIIPAPTKERLDFHKFPSNQSDLDYYFRFASPMIAEWQCPSFWLTSLPCFSERSLANKYSLLAISAGNQTLRTTCPDTMRQLTDRGNIYYTKACTMLQPEHKANVEDALMVSLTLWGFDWFFGKSANARIHAVAAIKLSQSLAEGDNMSLPSALSNTSRLLLLDTTRDFFHCLNFPIDEFAFTQMLGNSARLDSITDDSCANIRWAIPSKNPFAKLATPPLINAFFWLITFASSKQELYTIQQALRRCACEYTTNSLPKCIELEIFGNEIRLFTLLCEVHLDENGDREQERRDEKLSEMLDLIRTTYTMLTARKHAPPFNHHRNRKATDLGILGFVSQQANDHKIRNRANSQMLTYGV